MTTPENVLIRPEIPADIPEIRAVHAAAFDNDAEARLVDVLRAQCPEYLAFSAITDGFLAGHILFTPVILEGAEPRPQVMGLAPVAVLPAYQRGGIGSRLIQTGLEACREANYVGVVLLGHPHYYPRFGFVPSVQFGFKSTYDVADDTFMARELEPGAFRGCSGAVARYHPAFDTL